MDCLNYNPRLRAKCGQKVRRPDPAEIEAYDRDRAQSVGGLRNGHMAG